MLGYANRSQAGNYAEALKLAEQTHTTPDVIATQSRRHAQIWNRHQFGTGHHARYRRVLATGLERRQDRELGLHRDRSPGERRNFAQRARAGIARTTWSRPRSPPAEFPASTRSYLAHGGLDFLIGDGRLNYAPEYVWETYYSARLFPGFFAAFDFQHDANPAYNHDRGPVWIYSLRLHAEFGIKPFQAK